MIKQDVKLEDGFQLYDCTIFPSLNVIENSDRKQHVEPKVMQVLLLLTSKPNIVISRQELLDQVWTETYSHDEALTRCISLLRSSLGDNKDNHQFIETVSKSGYRLIAPVVVSTIRESLNAGKNGEQQSQPISPKWVILGAIIILSMIGYFLLNKDAFITTSNSIETSNSYKKNQMVKGASIAVLPFINMSDDPSNEYLSDGISEEILNILAQIPKLKVISRTSSFSFKGKEIILSEVAKKLGVNNILEGSVRMFGNRIRVSAQLIEAETDTHLWSNTYNRELVDLFTIQDEISAEIVKALKPKLGLGAQVSVREATTLNLNAYNEYLKGRYFIEKRTQKDITKALVHFEKAIEISPDYALAWMGKAWANITLSESLYGNIPIEIAVEQAKPAAEKALLLDPELPEAHAIMGLILWRENRDNNKVISHIEKAIELNPNYADAYVWLASRIQDPLKRLSLRTQAVQLNPISLLTNLFYNRSLNSFGKLEEAQEIANHMIDLDKYHSFPFYALGETRKAQGLYGEAAYYYQKSALLTPGTTGYMRDHAENLFAIIGLTEQAIEMVEDTLRNVYQYKYQGKSELFISKLREQFPRSDKDELGTFYLATEEARLGNTKNAISFYRTIILGKTSEYRIYSYMQEGESETAMKLLNEKKKQYTELQNAGIQFLQNTPIELEGFEIANLEGDIDQAIILLQAAMKKGVIITPQQGSEPLYSKLKAHPQWSIILEESTQRASEQREIYLKLITEEANATL